jgi:hypothetical protein
VNKRNKRTITSLEEATNAPAPMEPPPAPPQATPQPLSLADIRLEVLKAHSKTAHTIADLEAWRAEIEATIAFLKARGR